ncbi:MAG: HAMP domain-containing histidine kinase [Clostridia bacterium]|nr:HAMP domain-containing histidine kinase [Clostridia bacterium]
MRKLSGVTKRWLYSAFSVIAGIILAVAVTAVFLVKGYYYNYVEMTLDSHASDLVNNYFSNYIGTGNDTFVSGAINFVENFSDKDMMDVWVIDSSGRPVVSASGFEIQDNMTMPDYDLALTSDTDKGIWTGRLSNGEKVMAVTAMLPDSKGQVSGAIRYICSLEEVDNTLLTITVFIALLAAGVMLLVLATGSFFIRSIVRPVLHINDTAKEIAKGNLSARVDSSGMHDEIDELGSTFNDMACALGQAEELKNDFISTISHELRTPLTAIKGWGETLIGFDNSDPETTKRGMSVIIDESQRLAEMVEELLDFSRMQSGKMRLNMGRYDILAELDDAVFAMKNRAAREGLEFTYDVPQLTLAMYGDAGKIKQVFVNLLDNAIKYNKPGGKISVVAQIVSDNLVIRFTDTGCGISAEDIPHIKERFYRANLSVHGTGIGLAVADEIIKMHNATMEIESVLDEGTTITVTFPLETSDIQQFIND